MEIPEGDILTLIRKHPYHIGISPPSPTQTLAIRYRVIYRISESRTIQGQSITKPSADTSLLIRAHHRTPRSAIMRVIVATPDITSSSRVAAGQTCDEGFKNSYHTVDDGHQYAADATYDDHDTVADSCKG